MLRGVCVFISEFMIKPAASEILGFLRGRSTPYPFPRGVCRSRSWEKSDMLFGRAIVGECGGGRDLILLRLSWRDRSCKLRLARNEDEWKKNKNNTAENP